VQPVRETLTERVDGVAFNCEGIGAPMKWATNRWSLQPHGDDQPLVTSVARLDLKGGIVGPRARAARSRRGRECSSALAGPAQALG